MSLKSRLSASLFNIIVTVTILTITGLLVFNYIYPYPYYELAGGLTLFWMIAAIDLILGPILAFTVAAPTKARNALKRDLLVIGFIQLAAFLYGFSVMYAVRPVYLVYEVDRFKVVRAQELTASDKKLAHTSLQKVPIVGVKIIGVRGAVSSADKLSSLDLEIAGKGLYLQTNWWQPLSDTNLAAMREHGQSIASLRQRPAVDIVRLDKLLQASGLKESEVIALPLVAPAASWTVLVNRQRLEFVGYLPIDLL